MNNIKSLIRNNYLLYSLFINIYTILFGKKSPRQNKCHFINKGYAFLKKDII